MSTDAVLKLQEQKDKKYNCWLEISLTVLQINWWIILFFYVQLSQFIFLHQYASLRKQWVIRQLGSDLWHSVPFVWRQKNIDITWLVVYMYVGNFGNTNHDPILIINNQCNYDMLNADVGSRKKNSYRISTFYVKLSM